MFFCMRIMQKFHIYYYIVNNKIVIRTEWDSTPTLTNGVYSHIIFPFNELFIKMFTNISHNDQVKHFNFISGSSSFHIKSLRSTSSDRYAMRTSSHPSAPHELVNILLKNISINAPYTLRQQIMVIGSGWKNVQ